MTDRPISGRLGTIVIGDSPALFAAFNAVFEDLRDHHCTETTRAHFGKVQAALDQEAVSGLDAGFPVDLPTLRRRMADHLKR
jgi:hypothetical protein